MFAVAWRALLDRKWTIAAFLAVGIFFAWIYVVTYPSVQATQASLTDFIKNLPEPLVKAFALDPATFGTFQGYVAGKQFSLFWPILLTSLLGGLSANFVSSDIEKGTIEMTLSQPISRIRVFLARLGAGIAADFIYVAFSVLSYIPIAAIYGIPHNSTAFILMAEIGFILGLAFFGIGMLFSSIFSEKDKALFLTIGVFVAMYVIYFAALLDSRLQNLKYGSLLYYYDYNSILTAAKVVGAAWPVLLGTFVLFAASGLFWFNKRDIIT
jgi:ABC-type transport system involved in multi-copper enzyme maturation permease subunit